jgi:predicted sulfurtransferase
MTKHKVIAFPPFACENSSEKDAKKKRKRDKEKVHLSDSGDNTARENAGTKQGVNSSSEIKIVSSSATSIQKGKDDGVSLVLFYQYVEPPWTPAQHRAALTWAKETGDRLGLGGRMRIAREGFNCTLTGTYDAARLWCKELRDYCPEFFSSTEFKITDFLPKKQMFSKLHCFSVDELVNYGFTKTNLPPPPLSKVGAHLEPEEYHKKIQEKDTVIIDVRNHYEAAIGHFRPPEGGAKLIDPLMRKSTEFPCWLDKPETKEQLRGKQVLMYCTGGKHYFEIL